MSSENAQSETQPLCLECLGLTFGGHMPPAFQIGMGEAVCLHVEYSPSAVPWYDCVLPLLIGRIQHPAIRIHGLAANLERPFPRRRWLIWRKDPSAREWLRMEGNLSPQETAHVLSLVPVPPEMPVGWLGW